MELKGLVPLSAMSQAQIYLTHLRIHVIGKEIDEFQVSDFRAPLAELRGLRVVELMSISSKADVFLCGELVPYLLSLEELDHVNVINVTWGERRIGEDVKVEFAKVGGLLEERNRNFLAERPA